MNNKSAKQITKSYKLIKVGTLIAYAFGIVIGALLLKTHALLGICIIVALLMSAKSTFDMIREKTVERVIYEDLDSEKFSEIVKLGAFGKSKHHKMLAAMYSGDHETILSITEENLKKQSNPVELCNNLYKRGFVYFEREDYDSLAKTVNEFKKLKAQHPKFAGIFENYSVFEKYDALIDEDYEYIVEICEYDLKNDSKKQQNHKLTILNVSFYRAVALYKLERFDEARAAFENIIAFAPKTYKATLAKEYLKRPELN